MNVLSLFDGMSCGMIALDRLGIKVDKYYASEIDKYAMQVSAANYPEIIQVGDVCDLKSEDFKDIDLILAGSPCQGFSFSGKGLAFDDPRSALFFEFIRLLKEIKPKYFLLENVKMKKEYLDIISEYTEVEPIFIQSSLVSAQSRQRYYWTNIPNIQQPKDRGIALKEILEYQPDSYTIMSDKFSKRQEGRKCLVDMNKEKAASLSAMEYVKNGRQGDYLAYDADGKPRIVCAAYRGRYNEDGSISQRLELRKDDKTNTITTVQKDNVLTKDQAYWRKLTPIECERLQTVPDNYTNHVSNTQRYKMLGNGWTIEVIAHILKNMEVNQ
jgi:DNA-cytosine methyltransferase